MQETLQLIVDYKLIHPLRFWTFTYLLIILICFTIIIILRNRKKSKQKKKQKEYYQTDKSIQAKYHKKVVNTSQKHVNTKNEASSSQKNKEPFNPNKASTTPKNNSSIVLKTAKKEQVVRTINKPKEQLLKAKEEPYEITNEIKFVNYQISIPESKSSFPVFRYPSKGTVVRTHRLGNTKRRGFKEESFQKSIENLFSDHFDIIGNARINTGRDTRPFEPDIAIVEKSCINNLRIDIEIDEPYAGITRQPTHCVGEDTSRDNYFIDRGWIVIRFSEYQVHTQEDGCLRFIAEIIQAVIPEYQIPSNLSETPSISTEKLWSVLQAQQWEKAKYREKYLNHEFQYTEEKNETDERDLNPLEKIEEDNVNNSSNLKVDNRINSAFNVKNAHLRDTRIKFYPEPHEYTIDNIPAKSVSTIVGKHFPEFNPEEWAPKTALKLGLTVDEVLSMWEEEGKIAAKKGSLLHEQIENYYLVKSNKKTEEFHLFEKFINDHNHLKPYRTEWRIYDETFLIAGTIDLVTQNGCDFEIYDWKRSKKIISNTGITIKTNQWQKGIGKLSDLDDTSYNRYSLQQSIYKYILEKRYNLTIAKMYLVILHPNYNNYYKVEVPYLKDKAEYILNTL